MIISLFVHQMYIVDFVIYTRIYFAPRTIKIIGLLTVTSRVAVRTLASGP